MATFPLDRDPYNNAADLADLYYCYRLLLGRHPDAQSWQWLKPQLETGALQVNALVYNFLHSPEFESRNLAAPPPAGDLKMVQLPEYSLYYRDSDWSVGRAIEVERTYEPHVTRAIGARLRPGMTFLDIGANIGFFSMLAARAVGPEGRVYSVEASQNNAMLVFLSARANGFTNVQVLPFALADRAATWLYVSSASNGSLVDFDGSTDLPPGSSLVYSIRLDDLLPEARPDIIKIDIEGSEYMAFEGGRQLVERSRPLIFSEFSPEALQNTSRRTGPEYLALLEGFGYRFSVIGADGTPVAADAAGVMRAFEAKRSTHIDILAEAR